jgi:hypothetical protein
MLTETRQKGSADLMMRNAGWGRRRIRKKKYEQSSRAW